MPGYPIGRPAGAFGGDALPSALYTALARFQPVMLVLDQLDALAGYLDLRTARLSILLEPRSSSWRDRHDSTPWLSSRSFEFTTCGLRAVATDSPLLELPGLWVRYGAYWKRVEVRAAGWPEDAKR